jgi:hypothetical protein
VEFLYSWKKRLKIKNDFYFSFNVLMDKHVETLFNLYKQHCCVIKKINSSLKLKKIRRNNFPEVISENIVLFYLQKYSISNCTYTWDTTGYLLKIQNNINYKIEVKCSSSNGPLSFSPVCNFHELYCVDATDFMNNNFKIYKINGNIKYLQINKTQTFLDQCNEKRRPRLSLELLLKQLPHELLFNDSIYSLMN